MTRGGPARRRASRRRCRRTRLQRIRLRGRELGFESVLDARESLTLTLERVLEALEVPSLVLLERVYRCALRVVHRLEVGQALSEACELVLGRDLGERVRPRDVAEPSLVGLELSGDRSESCFERLGWPFAGESQSAHGAVGASMSPIAAAATGLSPRTR